MCWRINVKNLILHIYFFSTKSLATHKHVVCRHIHIYIQWWCPHGCRVGNLSCMTHHNKPTQINGLKVSTDLWLGQMTQFWYVCVNTYCMLPSWIVELRQKKKTPKRTWTFLIGAHIEGHRSTCSSLSSLASTVIEPLKQILVSQSQSYPFIKQNDPIRSSRLALKQFLKAVLWERNRKVYKQQKSAMICAGLENKATMK